MKGKVAFYGALTGITLLGFAIYRHLTGGEPISIGEIIAIAVGAPLVGLSIWLRHDWVPDKVREMARRTDDDREAP